MSNRIVLLGGSKMSARIIYHALREQFNIHRVIIEEPPPRLAFLNRRIKRLGVGKVIGQTLFQASVVPWRRWASRSRIRQLMLELRLTDAPVEQGQVLHVSSVNSSAAIAALQQAQPNVVVVSGTRIIAPAVLSCVKAPFMNLHSGITPLYRGVYGAYWSLVERNHEACGVTVHLIDAGLDSGGILKQTTIAPTEHDDITTYPLLQLAAGIPLLEEAICEALQGKLTTRPPWPGESRVWSHPTILQYFRYRIGRGVA